MLSKFQNHLSQNLTFLKDGKLLLAVSGGIDSMVMAELFRRSGYDVSLAHCNFKLRAHESDEDAGFVKRYAETHDLKIQITHFDTQAFANDNKLSIQLAARQLRYLWFHEMLEQNSLDYILTAHHADDSLETFLINFSRGTGLEGLTGIPQINGKIVRPLLAFGRNEIEDFAEENHLEWREDASNASDKYLRNKIRHGIVPKLKELHANFLASFQETSAHLQQAKSMVRDAANLVYKQVAIEKEDRIIFEVFELKRLENYRAYLYEWLREFGFTAWEDIYGLVDAQSGKQVFSPGFVLLKDREVLILQQKTVPDEAIYEIGDEAKSIDFPINISITAVTDIQQTTDNRIFVDLEKLTFPLQLRKWREGDNFRPFGMKGTKKVAKFFKDEKLSLVDKTGIWILLSAGEIVWIVGKRADDRFKVTKQTSTILQLSTT